MKNYTILIPVYNDWDSLFTLLQNIDHLKLDAIGNLKVLVIDDCSTENLQKKLKFNSLIGIEIIKNEKNIGHGKSIARGIKYISEKYNFDYLIAMDGDGEDRPEEVKQLIIKSLDYPSNTITANRVKRSEGFLFKICYQLHKLITLALTGNIIKFGNFMCIPNKDLRLILNNNNLFVSFSGTVAKFINNKINIPSTRGTRYQGPTKMSFLKLIKHSLLIISVFKEEVIFRLSIFSLVYSVIVFLISREYFFILTMPIVFLITLIISAISYLHYENYN